MNLKNILLFCLLALSLTLLGCPDGTPPPEPGKGESFTATPSLIIAKKDEEFAITLRKLFPGPLENRKVTVHYSLKTPTLLEIKRDDIILNEGDEFTEFIGLDMKNEAQISFFTTFKETEGGYFHEHTLNLTCNEEGSVTMEFAFELFESTQRATAEITCEKRTLPNNNTNNNTNNANNDPNNTNNNTNNANNDLPEEALSVDPPVASGQRGQEIMATVRNSLFLDATSESPVPRQIVAAIGYDPAMLEDVGMDDIDIEGATLGDSTPGSISYHFEQEWETDGVEGMDDVVEWFNEHQVTLKCKVPSGTTDVTFTLGVLETSLEITCTGPEPPEIDIPAYTTTEGTAPGVDDDGCLVFAEFGIIQPEMTTPQTGTYQIKATATFDNSNPLIIIHGSADPLNEEGRTPWSVLGGYQGGVFIADTNTPRHTTPLRQPARSGSLETSLTVSKQHHYLRADAIFNTTHKASIFSNESFEVREGSGVLIAAQDVTLCSITLQQDLPDADDDGVEDDADNCTQTPNIRQLDIDNDGIGEACQGNMPQLPSYTVISGEPFVDDLGCLSAEGDEGFVIEFDDRSEVATDFEIIGAYYLKTTSFNPDTHVRVGMFNNEVGDGPGALVEFSRNGHRAVVMDGTVNWAPISLPRIFKAAVFSMSGTLSPTEGQLSINVNHSEFNQSAEFDMLTGEGDKVQLEVKDATVCSFSFGSP